ncbi:MAG: tetratricopeptide repeat protein, partial [Ktedonobacteraceae bacterium]|nr:tetratricopeptide repeat protein [Ktedonobacteraceae bacterium]
HPSPFLPMTSVGHVLITSRAADLSDLGLGISHPLHLATFSDDQGVRLLLHRAGLLDQATDQDRDIALSITQELGGLALALDQAGAYIAATCISLDTYLRLFQERQVDLLKQRRNRDYPESVITTWTLSFQRVESRNPAAAELLNLCAFFAPDAIPEEIFIEDTEEPSSTLAPVTADPFLLNDAIEALLSYSLIARDPHVQTLSVHRLIQVVVRNSLSAKTRRHWMQRAIDIIEAALPESLERANWPTFERLLPHALICVTWIKQAAFTTTEAFRLVKQAGLYLNARASYRDAESLLRHVLVLCEQRLGIDHLDTAIYRNALAMNAVNQGKYSQAEPLLVSVLVLSEQQLGAMHPETIQRRNTLVELYRVQGKFAEAEPLLEKMCIPREDLVKDDIPHMINSLTNLALLYWDQLKFDKVGSLRERALVLYEHLPPETDHLHQAIILTNLAMLFLNQGEDTQAETFFQRTFAIVEELFATNHIFTAISLNNLAELYSIQGKDDEAELVYQQALALCKRLSGVDHPHTALCLNNLAGFFVRQGKLTKAEPLYHQALTIREQRLEPMHPDVAQSLNNLAVVFMNQGIYIEAEPLLERMCTIFEYQYGSQHFYTALCFNNLAELYHMQGKFAKAELLHRRVLDLYERPLGNKHPYTILSRDILTRFFESWRRSTEGEPLSLSPQMLIIREQQWGPIIEARIRALTTWLCFI